VRHHWRVRVLNLRFTPLAVGLAAVGVFVAACAPSAPPVRVTPPTAAPAPATAVRPTAAATALPVAVPAAQPAPVTAPVPAILPAAPGKLEIFSWWTTGGEAAGLNALFEAYRSRNPGVEIINATVAGGAGSNAKAVLKTRMLGGAPPDSFQIHMGHELTDTWVVTGKMEPLDDIYTQMGWYTAFPKGVLDIVSFEGKPYSVPVNIHRANVLWYNKRVFRDNGLQPPATFDDFFRVAETLKGKGITPLAFANKEGFEGIQIFETIAIGVLGADGYTGLWTGKTAWTGPEVTRVLTIYKQMLASVNPDYGDLTWDQANDLLVSGKAGMTIMGDWIDADYAAKKFTDYGWTTAPGNAGIYDALSDGFGLPQGARDVEQVRNWLRMIGTPEAQDAFNPLKGSVPVNLNAGKGNYDAYLRSAIADWKDQTVVASLAHGAAASEGWLAAISDDMAVFLVKQDVSATQASLSQDCLDARVCS
jgi:glucose/mannose transport system substrate-binding protein